jgi:hypothetical protein
MTDTYNKDQYLKEQLKYQYSIDSLQQEINLSRIKQSRLQKAYDSMKLIEPEVIYRTHEKVKFIYSDASTSELDSIIRSNWKTETGHN